jgi:hypothetical protein
MSSQASFILYLAVLTALLIPAKKWAGMNPFRIEDGPSWKMAALSAGWTMLLFIIALAHQAADNTKTAAFFSEFAFGSAIGACFLTRFKPAPEEQPNAFLRWWTGVMDGFADSVFKSLIVIPVGALVSWVSHVDGRYWTAVVLALVLVFAKTDNAVKARRSETDHELYLARQRMLISGNVLFTMIVGVICLVGWLGLTRPVMLSLEPFKLSLEPSKARDYLHILGFVLGVGLHLR